MKYLNGFSSSLPEEIQYKALTKIPGLQHVKMFRPGYAIEYDYFPPTQLSLSLETHRIKNLFFAGQINGTTGYEEAACQGLMAGINAALNVKNEAPLILTRSQAYIGVLIDDLVNKGTEEPYRMFTSRAEYRILLRQDNADIRLTELAMKCGMLNMEERFQKVQQKQLNFDRINDLLQKKSIAPEDINPYLLSLDSTPIETKTKLALILTRPNVTLSGLMQQHAGLKEALQSIDDESLEGAEINIKYEGYIRKEQEFVEKMSRLESVKILPNYNFNGINALSNEAKTKLTKIKPQSIGQASRISGVSPADISVLLVHLGR